MVSSHLSGWMDISFLTCASLILCSSLMGTRGSSLRYSTKAMRPPDLSDFDSSTIISWGNSNS